MKQTHDQVEAVSPEEERELRAVVALLRGLPDPEPPEDLGARVMAEVRRRESGPRVLRVAFRRMEPLVASALAAGVGALVLTTAMQSGLLSAGTPALPSEGLQPSAARRVADAGAYSAAPARPRIAPTFVALPGADLHAAHLRGAPAPTPLTAGVLEVRPSLANPLDRRLDHELNSLLLDPNAFYARTQEMAAPELFLARLVDRAMQRGDATQIALRLRQRAPEHPSTAVLVDRLLRASMAEETRH